MSAVAISPRDLTEPSRFTISRHMPLGIVQPKPTAPGNSPDLPHFSHQPERLLPQGEPTGTSFDLGDGSGDHECELIRKD